MNKSEFVGKLVKGLEGGGMKDLGPKELELRHVVGMGGGEA